MSILYAPTKGKNLEPFEITDGENLLDKFDSVEYVNTIVPMVGEYRDDDIVIVDDLRFNDINLNDPRYDTPPRAHALPSPPSIKEERRNARRLKRSLTPSPSDTMLNPPTLIMLRHSH